ncbi:MAG: flagellar hook-basal body complex protein FliE [Gammaproteobacteria bacterium]
MSDFKVGMPPAPSFQPGLTPIGGVARGASELTSDATSKLDFGTLVAQSINSVNETQQGAAKLAEQFELGDPSVDLVRVMVEMQKARVSFEAVSQVRNKLVEAYREVMNMQV